MLKSPQLIIVISGPERRKIVLEIDSRVVVVVKTMKAQMFRRAYTEQVYGILLSNPSHIDRLGRRDCALQTQHSVISTFMKL